MNSDELHKILSPFNELFRHERQLRAYFEILAGRFDELVKGKAISGLSVSRVVSGINEDELKLKLTFCGQRLTLECAVAVGPEGDPFCVMRGYMPSLNDKEKWDLVLTQTWDLRGRLGGGVPQGGGENYGLDNTDGRASLDIVIRCIRLMGERGLTNITQVKQIPDIGDLVSVVIERT